MAATQGCIDQGAAKARQELRDVARRLHDLSEAADAMARLWRPGVGWDELARLAYQEPGQVENLTRHEASEHVTVYVGDATDAIGSCNDDYRVRQREIETGRCCACDGNGVIPWFRGENETCHACAGTGKPANVETRRH